MHRSKKKKKKSELLCDKDVLKDQYWSLMKEYTDITNIPNYNGLAWNEIQQIVIVDDDDVWKAYNKVLFFFSVVMLLG